MLKAKRSAYLLEEFSFKIVASRCLEVLIHISEILLNPFQFSHLVKIYHSIIQQMYSKARVRLVLTGFEVWDKRDLANTGNTKSSGELHANFKAYSRKLRLQQGKHFDVSIHVL